MEIESLARSYTPACMKQLGGWATGEKVEAELKFKAIALLLDRGWGKPYQSIKHSGADGGALEIVIRNLMDESKNE